MQLIKEEKEEVLVHEDEKKSSPEEGEGYSNSFDKKIGDAGTDNRTDASSGSGESAFFTGDGLGNSGGTGNGGGNGIEDRFADHTITKDDLSDSYVTGKFAEMSTSELFEYRRACTDADVKSGILDVIKAKDKDPYKSYMGKPFTINNTSAVIRDSDYNPIKYKDGDAIPDGKKVGDDKTIPDQTVVYITNYEYVSGSERYVYAEDYGWTSADNLKGGFFNETIGKKEIKWDSIDDTHKTYGGEDANVRKKDSYGFEERVPEVVFPNGTSLTVIETMDDSKGVKYVNATSTDGTLTGWTKASNLKISTDGKTATVNDPQAIIRDKVGYGETSDIIHQGDRVVVKEYSDDTDPKNKYARVFSTKKDGDKYIEDKELGWVLNSKLVKGWADFKSETAEWKDMEYTGQVDIVNIVGNKGETRQVSVENAAHYQEMAAAAAADGVELRVESGFRHYKKQAELVYGYAQQQKGVAGYTGYNPADPAGDSKHQLGMAFDLNNKHNVTVDNWMKEHAWEYGFIKPYDASNEYHHWEYRPNEIKKPDYYIKGGKYYKKTYYSSSRKSYEVEITKEVYDANVPAAESTQPVVPADK